MNYLAEQAQVSLPPAMIAGRMRKGAGGAMVFLDCNRPAENEDGITLSIIGRRPWRTITCSAGQCAENGRPSDRDIWSLLRGESGTLSPDTTGESALPLPDHLFGYLSYDLALPMLGVPLPPPGEDDPSLPEALFYSFDELAVHHHESGETWLIAGGRLRPAEDALADLHRLLAAPAGPADELPTREQLLGESVPEGIHLHSNFSQESYLPAVERVREYIGAGDSYIVNLSRRITAETRRGAWESYLRLRALSPVPYGAFLETPEFAVLSASMERFLRIRAGLAQTSPIKGTRPRGKTPEEDGRNRQELMDSEKDHAELLMIVDLERNDLARVCTPESVEVLDLFRLEAYASVFHLDATVRGRLAPGRDAVDALAALFPGGSITGAPKRRSMEIISELENTRRGLYTGSLGWLSPRGDADFSILIRTLVHQDGRIWYSTGGGITWDSDPGSEYLETCDKAKFLERVV